MNNFDKNIKILQNFIQEINEDLKILDATILDVPVRSTNITNEYSSYFIEDANEYLQIFEDAILNLPEFIEDLDKIHEVFRATFALKGGAAMLGYDILRKYVFTLEKSFIMIRDYPEFAGNLYLKQLLCNLHSRCKQELMNIEKNYRNL